MRTILAILAIALVMTGCSGKNNAQTQQQNKAEPLCTPVPVRHAEWEEQAKAIAAKVDGIDEVVAVQIDNDLNLAIKVSNFNRFKLQSIEKEVAGKLKTAFPDSKVHVTSDKKLFMDLQSMSGTPWPTDVKEACQKKKAAKELEKKMKG
ncbi:MULTISPECIES: YhcN/YlaJ family sporulation lipoprotein [Brevibacillus]|jgi:Sporulation lipoprotein YhcN/YlaJ (Spore_YhcN_YlaJ).|uniref:Sporulation protein n=1 Tax=Brevibacillus parabrevis TaxID=54914 RepID=A0A4Y3PD71_BREPA|nr:MULTISPECIES: YhcN/YlaJ family sporulation lipoprotein [Brevibacillus]MBU8712427.1 YhcN/YlaJ family sporulation lipoprotein [Brevibacillus parabrevis]MDR5002471.1 YhcN/YlaJ family sporulation lipoprotein [Brevibacillus parabrevis]MED2257231.1 YhcN/YlaJ family sporulation lipoprotein [Brevibacillus parabrevis]NRQ52525.1 YhcN/YlaJ family sporulation lipoprotein [Brevibacillus sp. HD1.4A]RNB96032.1 sporulation protein [Brevibacillus parabrevis]